MISAVRFASLYKIKLVGADLKPFEFKDETEEQSFRGRIGQLSTKLKDKGGFLCHEGQWLFATNDQAGDHYHQLDLLKQERPKIGKTIDRS